MLLGERRSLGDGGGLAEVQTRRSWVFVDSKRWAEITQQGNKGLFPFPLAVEVNAILGSKRLLGHSESCMCLFTCVSALFLYTEFWSVIMPGTIVIDWSVLLFVRP